MRRPQQKPRRKERSKFDNWQRGGGVSLPPLAVRHDGAVELGALEARVGQDGVGEVGTLEIGATQIGGVEVRAIEVDAGVRLLLGDSTNAERPGVTQSEKVVGEAFRQIGRASCRERVSFLV